MPNKIDDPHNITYCFVQYRCAWKCSCGAGSKLYTKDTYLGANRKARKHRSKVGLPEEHDYYSMPYFELFKEQV